MGSIAGKSISKTFEGDIFPQFSHHGKSNFNCEICIPFQKWAKENGKSHSRLRFRKQGSIDDVLNGTGSLTFSGFSMLKEHAKAKYHVEAIEFFQSNDERINGKATRRESNLSKKSKLSLGGQQEIGQFFKPLNEKRPPDHRHQRGKRLDVVISGIWRSHPNLPKTSK